MCRYVCCQLSQNAHLPNLIITLRSAQIKISSYTSKVSLNELRFKIQLVHPLDVLYLMSTDHFYLCSSEVASYYLAN